MFYKVVPLLETYGNFEDEVVWLRFEILLLIRCEKCTFPILKSLKSHTNFTSSVAPLNLEWAQIFREAYVVTELRNSA